ncbi:MAG: hypothetical protein AAF307_05050 [Pseudomonadota bacterium]
MTPQDRIGLAPLTKMAFAGNDLAALRMRLLSQSAARMSSAGLLMDLSVIEQLNGNKDAGLAYQDRALADCRTYRSTTAKRPGAPTVLVLAAPVQMGSNTPVDFLLEGSGFDIVTHFVAPGATTPADLPEHDVVFVAAPGDDGPTRPYINTIADLLTGWHKPVLNAPGQIMKLDRDVLPETLRGLAGIHLPPTEKYSHAALSRAVTHADRTGFEGIGPFPWVIRPTASHAGRGLEKIRSLNALRVYLDIWPEAEFFVSPFVDYRTPADGLFRKYRIIFVDGQAYPCHMALSDQWKIWYLNAGMDADASKRAAEQAFMDGFETGFGARHRPALATIAERVGLQYVGIDCAEDQDGALLIFEADNALIVHDMDAPEIYPYKSAHMQRLFQAFTRTLRQAIEHQ